MVAAALLLAVFAEGCGDDCEPYGSATCRQLPVEGATRIVGFEVTTVTGGDSSDATIHFCVEQKSTTFEMCEDMDTSGDDFESGVTETFTLGQSLDSPDFAGFTLVNRGGAVFGNDEWEMVALRVVALLEGGDRFIVYDEPRVACGGTLDEGDRYVPMACW
jgi:hypothetical protein